MRHSRPCFPVLSQEVRAKLSALSSSKGKEESGLVDTTVSIMLMALPKQQQIALVQLSVFPSGFDDDGAAAVMGMESYRAHSVIQVRI